MQQRSCVLYVHRHPGLQARAPHGGAGFTVVHLDSGNHNRLLWSQCIVTSIGMQRSVLKSGSPHSIKRLIDCFRTVFGLLLLQHRRCDRSDFGTGHFARIYETKDRAGSDRKKNQKQLMHLFDTKSGVDFQCLDVVGEAPAHRNAAQLFQGFLDCSAVGGV